MSRRNAKKTESTETRGAMTTGGEADARPSHDEIAERAYTIYDRDGRIDGRDMDHWLRAETELRTERTGGRSTGTPRLEAPVAGN